jgi:ADP-ribosyl-[dinitrogen reductase] hydrolase
MSDKKLGAFFGVIVGDAYGSQYEFKPRGTYEVSPDMGPNVFGLPAGSFTDDASMMLCLAASLAELQCFDPVDQMVRYVRWWRDGYMSSSQKCFDIGHATRQALARFSIRHTDWTTRHGAVDATEADGFCPYTGDSDELSSGNGGIMRLAPVPIWYAADAARAREMSVLSSKLTHASPECLDAAALMSDVIVHLINGGARDAMPLGPEHYDTPRVKALAAGAFRTKTAAQVRTTGYVIDTLEAALFALHTTASFEEGMVMLAGMGGDVDTVCCVFGQIAGAHYGLCAIPPRWPSALQRQGLLWDVARGLVLPE